MSKELTKYEEKLIEEFNADSKIVGEQTADFLRLVYPSYLIDRKKIESLLDSNSTQIGRAHV